MGQGPACWEDGKGLLLRRKVDYPNKPLPVLLTRRKDLPLEYNAWLLFRQVVDVILLKYVIISHVIASG
jgi:hypothetical protein